MAQLTLEFELEVSPVVERRTTGCRSEVQDVAPECKDMYVYIISTRFTMVMNVHARISVVDLAPPRLRSCGRRVVSCKAAPGDARSIGARKRSEILKNGMMIGIGSWLGPWMPVEASESSAASVPNSVAISKPSSISQVMLSTLSDCQLAVSIYPKFSYNAKGGGGLGKVTKEEGDLIHVEWNSEDLLIPDINYSSSKVLGIPIPPPLNIKINPKVLKGTINRVTGEAALDFLAGFEFEAGPFYKAPPLVVETSLTTENSRGPLLKGTGSRMNGNGRAKLVGVARVPKTGDGFLDGFLMLPTDALAVLSADIDFS